MTEVTSRFTALSTPKKAAIVGGAVLVIILIAVAIKMLVDAQQGDGDASSMSASRGGASVAERIKRRLYAPRRGSVTWRPGRG